MTGRAKWDAWNATGKKYPDEQSAETRYLEMAKELGWNETEQPSSSKPEASKGKGKSDEGEEGDIWDSEEESSSRSGGGLGFAVSTMSHTKEKSERTLHGFAVENDVKGIEELLSLVPDLDLNEVDEHGYTPLHLAADRGNLDVVQLLLGKGVDQSIKDPDDMTAIELAQITGRDDIVLALSG
ncbi:hypothetical protein NP233_g2005 [Leucocoprinus birnbaumii]|uniref:ACB domain-containing protein n=1 Tax=Leucocoprinus birnbaumii TaxID=56174 RepID=A0AAD5W1I7_9AGAR|nr:hypothetical protein NP233_g2005 [Leucocoprinus birnbaumii]